MSERGDLERRLGELERERENIMGRLALLRASEATISPGEEAPRPVLGQPASASVPVTPHEKIDLFLTLFRCRESVFPKLWQSEERVDRRRRDLCAEGGPVPAGYLG